MGRWVAAFALSALLLSQTALEISSTGLAADSAAGSALPEEPPAALRAQHALRALAAAYPDRIAEVALRDGDWALRIEESWYYWAEGRLLPESARAEWTRYAPFRFYLYPAELPPVPAPDPRLTDRLKEREARGLSSPPERHGAFLDRLFQAAGRAETERHLGEVNFLGFRVRVHERLAAPLSAVAREVEVLRRAEPEVERFLQDLKGLAGYNWREIDGTLSRSYHGYGAALDLVPISYGGRHVYWRWSMPHVAAWYAIPYSERWLVPAAVVRAFERQGFVWGGKWLFFDTIHFEYRPEIFRFSSILQGREPAAPHRP